MGQPFVGEIRMFGGSFAPAGWAFCAGQLMPISENETLFTLIGTTYGGDGQSTFGLPDLRGRVPVHQGTLLGQPFVIGQLSGTESVTLTANQIPTHTHTLVAIDATGDADSPANAIPAAAATFSPYYSGNATVNMDGTMLSVAGSSQPHDNMLPFLTVSFIISLFGIFPSQN